MRGIASGLRSGFSEFFSLSVSTTETPGEKIDSGWMHSYNLRGWTPSAAFLRAAVASIDRRCGISPVRRRRHRVSSVWMHWSPVDQFIRANLLAATKRALGALRTERVGLCRVRVSVPCTLEYWEAHWCGKSQWSRTTATGIRRETFKAPRKGVVYNQLSAIMATNMWGRRYWGTPGCDDRVCAFVSVEAGDMKRNVVQAKLVRRPVLQQLMNDNDEVVTISEAVFEIVLFLPVRRLHGAHVQ